MYIEQRESITLEFNEARIFIENFEKLNSLSIQNSINLAAGVSNKVSIISIGSIPECLGSQFAKYCNVAGLDLQINFQSISAVGDLCSDSASSASILVVVIGDVHAVHRSNYPKLVGGDQNRRFEIVSSDFARYHLLERPEAISSSIPVDTLIWLKKLKMRYGLKEILSFMDRIKELNVAVVGESIFDEYVFTEALGKTSKDPMLAFLEQNSILLGGGTLAVARHLSGLGIKHSLFTAFGRKDLSLVREFLDSSTKLFEIAQDDLITIKKTRFIDAITRMKLFELYQMKESNIGDIVLNLFESNSLVLENSDLIMLFDYGHGYFDTPAIQKLSKFSNKVSANAQSNAGNRGLNSISKFKGFSSLFLNGSEVSNELRRRAVDLPTLISELIRTLECENLFVTNGAGGLVCKNRDGGVNVVPAFSPHIVDRTGAGDALMTLTSLMLSVGAPIDIAAFFGNVAGATVLGGIGNQISLNFDRIHLEIEAILHASERLG